MVEIMNKKFFFKKTLVITIITLFFCVSIAPCISAFIHKNIDEKKSINKQTNDIVSNPLDSLLNDDTASLTFYTFDKTGRKQNSVELSSETAINIKNVFEELENKIVYEPNSIKTRELKNSFINLLDENGLLSEKQSKDEVLSLLNPGWLKLTSNNYNLKARNPFSDALIKPFFGSYFGTSVFCSVSSAGSGILMPLFMLPRPRAVAMWFSSSYYGVTSVANLFTGKGFLAGGAQGGFLLGFMGIGLTYAIPGYTVYGFIGYSLFAGVTAEYMEFLPPNREPVVSGESPDDGALDVPVSLSKLSFRIEDPDKDLMNYTVTTDPDIGSGQGQSKVNGVYNIPVSGLEWDKKYSWTVSLSDGNILVEKKFSFITVGRPAFDPFDEGWVYRKKIIINHTQVDGNLVNFPILVSVTDSDLRDKAQEDGDDILFMDGAGVANKIYHEIENFDGVSGELVSWVKIPNLSSSQDTEFYMYYGNPSCDSQQFPEKVWDASYCGVWHLADLLDSTSNENDGTNHGTDDSLGKISFAKDFVGTNDNYIDIGDMLTPSDNIVDAATFEVWINPREGDSSAIINKMDNDYEPDRRGYNFHLEGNNTMFGVWSGTWYENGNEIIAKTDDSPVTYETWQYVAACVDLSQKNIILYHNGEEKDSSIIITGTPPSYFYNIDLNEWVGAYRGEGFSSYYNGVIDEIRISKICRSSSWISTEYNNQNDPFSFLSFGPEESTP
jgi:hypothetical protein